MDIQHVLEALRVSVKPSKRILIYIAWASVLPSDFEGQCEGLNLTDGNSEVPTLRCFQSLSGNHRDSFDITTTSQTGYLHVLRIRQK